MAYLTDADRLEIINSTTQFTDFTVRAVEKNGWEVEETAGDVDEALSISATRIRLGASYVEIFRIDQQTGELKSTIGAWRTDNED